MYRIKVHFRIQEYVWILVDAHNTCIFASRYRYRQCTEYRFMFNIHVHDKCQCSGTSITYTARWISAI